MTPPLHNDERAYLICQLRQAADRIRLYRAKLGLNGDDPLAARIYLIEVDEQQEVPHEESGGVPDAGCDGGGMCG